MSEYEIFNNETENVEVIPETKKVKKEKKVVVKEKAEKKECAFVKFLKENYNFTYLPAILAIFAIFFSLFVQFLPMVAGTFAAIQAAAAFFFIGFTCAFGALITEAICMIKEKKFNFNVKIILICLAFFVLFI